MVHEAYELMNKAWKSTTKILFGEEIGELKDFHGYLKGALIGQTVTSFFSGKPVLVVSDNYSKGSRFFDYIEEHEKFDEIASKPFDIDKIKDIDSIVETLKERFMYGGNKILGNSKYIEKSDAIIDSTSVLNSSKIVEGKYIAYSYLLQKSEYTFGSTSSGESSHIVRCFYNNTLRRCFECSTSVGSSDCYFVYNLLHCSDCMFSFNLRAKRYMIGNVQLDSSSYLKLKSKIISEISDDLKRKKKLDFSIIDIMNNA